MGKTSLTKDSLIELNLESVNKLTETELQQLIQYLNEKHKNPDLKNLTRIFSDSNIDLTDMFFLVEHVLDSSTRCYLSHKLLRKMDGSTLVALIKSFLSIFPGSQTTDKPIDLCLKLYVSSEHPERILEQISHKKYSLELLYQITWQTNYYGLHKDAIKRACHLIEEGKFSQVALNILLLIKDTKALDIVDCILNDSDLSLEELGVLSKAPNIKSLKIIYDEIKAKNIPLTQLNLIVEIEDTPSIGISEDSNTVLLARVIELLKSAENKDKITEYLPRIVVMPYSLAVVLLNEKPINYIKLNDCATLPKAGADAWENYVVRKKNWGLSFAYGSQKSYGFFMRDSVLYASRAIKYLGWDFSRVLNMCADRRMVIAKKNGNMRWKAFGATLNRAHSDPKLNGATTECTEVSYNTLRQEIIRRYNNHEFSPQSDYYDIVELDARTDQYGLCCVDIKQKSPCADGKIQFLNTFTILFRNKGWKVGDPLPINEKVTVYHASYDVFRANFTYIESLFQSCIEADNLDTLSEKCAELYWWICATKPWSRGDPSIAEMMIKSLFDFHGYKVPAWKEGVIPWVEATLAFDVEQFKRKFTNLLDGKIVPDEQPQVATATDSSSMMFTQRRKSPFFEKLVFLLTLRKKIIEKEQWDTGYGGTIIQIDRKTKRTMPDHVAQMYKACLEINPTLDKDIEQRFNKVKDIIASAQGTNEDIFSWIYEAFKRTLFRSDETQEFYNMSEQELSDAELQTGLSKGP